MLLFGEDSLKFDSQNLNLGVSPGFLSAVMSAGRARPFPTTISLAGLVQQQLNFSPCPAVQSGSRCQSGGEGGGGMLGLAVLSKQELVVEGCQFL